jgi:hypothetical protein
MKMTIIIIAALIIAFFAYVVMRNSVPEKTSITTKSKTQSSSDSKSIFYHEDDYRQVEIVPAENFNELIKQAKNVQDFAKKHSVGESYTDMMVREDTGYELKRRGIRPTELEAILAQLTLKKFTDVSTGIRPGEMKSENTFGYGENNNGLFFDVKSDTVLNIWIAGSIPADNEKVVKVLNEIGQKWNLLLMDWNSLELIDLKYKEQIEKYKLTRANIN